MSYLPDAVFLDLDDTIVDFTEEVVYRKTGSTDISGVTDYSGTLFDVCGMTQVEFYELMSDPTFWSSLTMNDTGRALIEVVERSGVPWTILTAVPSFQRLPNNLVYKARRAALVGKLDWFEANGITKYAIATEKRMFAGSRKILIDDSPERVDKFRKHCGIAITVPQPWNNEKRCPVNLLASMLGVTSPRKPGDNNAQSSEAYCDLVDYARERMV